SISLESAAQFRPEPNEKGKGQQQERASGQRLAPRQVKRDLPLERAGRISRNTGLGEEDGLPRAQQKVCAGCQERTGEPDQRGDAQIAGRAQGLEGARPEASR